MNNIIMRTTTGGTIFDFGEWKSAVASRKNDDGTLSFRTIDPGAGGFGFVVAGNTLVLRDSQHEYVFAPQSATSSNEARR